MSIEITVEGLGSGGDGVSRLEDGRVVFIPGGIPGDKVRVKLGTIRKKVQYAEIESLLEPSVDRVASRCPVTACGGCALREISQSAQEQFKPQRIVENLRRIAGISSDEFQVDFNPAPAQWRYRHRVRLHTRWSGKSWRLGFFERGSHKLVNYAGCSVLWPELEKSVSKLVQALNELGPAAQLKEVRLAYSRKDQRSAAYFLAEGNIEIFRRDTRWLDMTNLSGVEVETPRARWRHGNLELGYDHANSNDFSLLYEPAMFTQAFPEVNDALVTAVTRAVRPQTAPKVLELHSGIGNFSIPLARSGAEMVTYEANSRAAILAGRNARLAGVEVETHGEPDTEALHRIGEFGVLLMDPPRAGAKDVCAFLAKNPNKIERIVYVSCDSATLARDVKSLGQNGFRLISVSAFDMFPQTQHVEAIAVLAQRAQ